MAKSAWYQSLVNNQLHNLISGLKSDPFQNGHSISSALIPPTEPDQHCYMFNFRVEILTEYCRPFYLKDHDAYTCFIDCLNEQITMGDIDDDEYRRLAREWLDERQAPKLVYKVVLFSSAINIEDLPFTSKDIRDIVDAIKEHGNLVPNELLFINGVGNHKKYNLFTSEQYLQQECSWVPSN